MKSIKKRRRARGSGGVYLHRSVWWISYIGPDGQRQRESSGDSRKGVAERLLLKKTGARENNLPVVKNAEKLTFHEATQLVIDDYRANGKRSLAVVERRINKHLRPHFLGRRLASITTADITAFVAKRQRDLIVVRKARGEAPAVTKPVSAAEINREQALIKRAYSLAMSAGLIAMRPKITMLRESAARVGFFEADQLAAVLAHLPAEIGSVIRFAAITGWRIKAEILPLQWRQVDFAAGEVRLDAGTTKNGEGRVFPMTGELRGVLQDRWAEHQRITKAGHITPWVFFREVADRRGGGKSPRAILAFNKVWQVACRAAGCPGRLPHDLRRTAIRAFVRSGTSENVAMRLSGHKTRSVFDRYNIVSGDDLREAARRLDAAAVGAHRRLASPRRTGDRHRT